MAHFDFLRVRMLEANIREISSSSFNSKSNSAPFPFPVSLNNSNQITDSLADLRE